MKQARKTLAVLLAMMMALTLSAAFPLTASAADIATYAALQTECAAATGDGTVRLTDAAGP